MISSESSSVFLPFNVLSFSNECRRMLAWLMLAALVMLQPVSANAQSKSGQSARTLINNMSNAVRTLNYDGVFIYQRGGQMNTLRLIHRVDENGESERLVSLTGSAREVIRDNQFVTCIFPDDETVVIEKSRPRELFYSQLPPSTEKLGENYDFSVVGEDRIAGRPTWIVSIKPRDGYRYGYQFWIDQQNNFLLKSELKNQTGLLLEQIMFTRLDILDAVPDEMLKTSIADAGFTRYNNIVENKELSRQTEKWQVTWMPSGFTKNSDDVAPLANGKTPVHHMVYSDGLAMVSIFIEKIDAGLEINSGLSKMGGINTYAKVANGYQVTAVGEVPQATVQRMANSVIVDQ